MEIKGVCITGRFLGEYFMRFDINELEAAETTLYELAKKVRPNVLEMAKIKTRFDAEKFTVGKEGNFIASQFHFLMRQYGLAVDEAKRMLLNIEECERKILGYSAEIKIRKDPDERCHESTAVAMLMESALFPDIEIKREQIEKERYVVDLKAKLMMIDDFEELRLVIIKNNGKEVTAEQYEEEQPDYYQWFLSMKAMNQINSRSTGVNEGVIEAFQQGARKPVVEGSKMQISPIDSDKGPLYLEDVLRARMTIRDQFHKLAIISDGHGGKKFIKEGDDGPGQVEKPDGAEKSMMEIPSNCSG